MSAHFEQHLDEERLLAIALGIEPESDAERHHLHDCAHCRLLLRDERELSAAISLLPHAAPPSDFVQRTTLRFSEAKRQVSVKTLWIAAVVTLFVGAGLGLVTVWSAVPQLGLIATKMADALTQAAAVANTMTVLISVFPALVTTVVVGCSLCILLSASVLSRLARATAK